MKLLAILSLLVFYHCPSESFDPIGSATNAIKNLNQGGKIIGQVVESGKNISIGMALRLPELFPTPEAFLDTGKQFVAGYPFEIASSAINEFCSQINAAGALKSAVQPDINKMSFVLFTPCKRTSFPLKEANKMWKSPDFDPKKKVVILVTGWTTDINETDTIPTVSKAYLCRSDTNFIALDAAAFVDTLYTWSSLNTEDIGKEVAEGLAKLVEVVPADNIHLIGHSLGAHIVGFAGRYFNLKTKQFISRITGLDPAKPCFKEGEVLNGLFRGDGKVVDIIHSNSGVLGKREPLGDIDFYPNGLDPIAKGCLTIVCAHARSWEYYAESVYPGNENNFMASRCSSLTALNQNKCPTDKYPMGFAAPMNLKGNYFLEVNSRKPYGKNSSKDQRQLAECGKCSHKE